MRSDRTQEPAGLSEAVNGFRGWRGFDSEAMDQRAWLLWAVPLAASVAHIAVSGLARFPEEFDGLAYHIPLIDHWFQAQSLYAVDAAWWWTPANAELLGYWIVAPFSGDFLIALGNLPFLVLWVLAAVEFARLLGLSVIWRHLGVLAMLAVHTTFHEAEKAMNDLAVAAFFSPPLHLASVILAPDNAAT